MNTNVNLLLVDDDKFHLNIFANKLSYLKFNQIRIASTIKEAIDCIYDQTPDLIITDFFLENGYFSRIADFISYTHYRDIDILQSRCT